MRLKEILTMIIKTIRMCNTFIYRKQYTYCTWKLLYFMRTNTKMYELGRFVLLCPTQQLSSESSAVFYMLTPQSCSWCLGCWWWSELPSLLWKSFPVSSSPFHCFSPVWSLWCSSGWCWSACHNLSDCQIAQSCPWFWPELAFHQSRRVILFLPALW